MIQEGPFGPVKGVVVLDLVVSTIVIFLVTLNNVGRMDSAIESD